MADVIRAAFNIFLIVLFIVVVLQLAHILPSLCVDIKESNMKFAGSRGGYILEKEHLKCYRLWNWQFWSLINSGLYITKF